MSLFDHKPSKLIRELLRLPIPLYRMHLGWLLDHRFMLLTHRGRKSGRVRHTVLEVIRYDPSSRESLVLSGWGTESEWFRNIETAPALAVQIGQERFEPIQRILTDEEGYAALNKWEHQHRLQAWLFRKFFGLPSEPTSQNLRDFVASHPLVTFRPRTQRQNRQQLHT